MINLIWALADVVIIYTFFRFGQAEFPPTLTKPMFIGWGLVTVGSPAEVQNNPDVHRIYLGVEATA